MLRALTSFVSAASTTALQVASGSLAWSETTRGRWIDASLSVVIAGMMWFLAAHTACMLTPVVVGSEVPLNYFEADIARVFNTMTERPLADARASVHPAFAVLTYPVITLLERATPLDPVGAVVVFNRAIAAVWAATLFWVLRFMGLRRLDACVFATLGVFSAASVFWFAVPETYHLGSLSILAALLVAAVSRTRRLSTGVYFGVGLATLGITVTNWVAGITALAAARPWRRVVQISVNVFACMTIAAVLQGHFFQQQNVFPNIRHEAQYLSGVESPSVGRRLDVMTSHSLLMPPVASRFEPNTGQAVYTIQNSPAFAGDRPAWQRVAAVVWLALLAGGMVHLCRLGLRDPFRLTLLVTLASQIVLHLAYGVETFLYALHIIPLLICVAATTVLATRLRPIALAVAIALVVAAAFTNIAAFGGVSQHIAAHVHEG